MAADKVVVVGAGMGGLLAALRLARAGVAVRVLEARSQPGGLAGALVLDDMPFDAGPYILLDRPGLEWAFRAVGLELADLVSLKRIDDIYEVQSPAGTRVRIRADREETAAGLERQWPGSGRLYLEHVHRVAKIYQRLEPLQRESRPGLRSLLRSGGWRDVPFLLRSLDSVLSATGLPAPVCNALAIWTHVAGQRVADAPSPLAFVPALMHGVGAFYATGGIGQIPRVLAEEAQRRGVTIEYGVRVTVIRRHNGRASRIETDRGEIVESAAIISNAAGVGTYLDLLDELPPSQRTKLERLPLQSPGVAAFLAVRGQARPPYLRFFLPGSDERCRCFVIPAVMEPNLLRDGWHPARLIGPMDHAHAQAAGLDGQRRYLEAMLAEPWWREHIDDYRVLATRIPVEWGRQYHLHRDSMNPVMTARFMRAGRLAHRSPHAAGLYLAGSATHPGQWVSFCAISGVLAAERLLKDQL